MKSGIHPAYGLVKVKCNCGNTFEVSSTHYGDLKNKSKDHPFIPLDVCFQCHPFFTGKQKIIDTSGRVERFQKKYGGFGSHLQDTQDTGSV